MKTLLLSGVTALALTVAASAQNASDSNNANPPAATAPSATTANAGGGGQFITEQKEGEVRAPKLVGVAVYDKDNKSVGKISDILMDKQGKVQAVVIGIGGFLGIGTKDVALPYDQVHWQTEQRTVATNNAPGAAPGTNGAAGTGTNTGATGGMGATTSGGGAGGVTGTTTANNANTTQPAGGAQPAGGQTAQKTVTPEQQEAYNGYPDRAVVDMSQQQLKDAPEFKYASQTANSAADVNAKKQ